ncbi:MAG: anti-sigma F factor [Lachnospiraceae bacterium]|nr:anti-sigma F factor [Lachnospiraceae bacterium]
MRENNMKIEFDSVSENEGFARVAVAAFASNLNPTLEEIEDIKTAVSEAVTNAIIHGYPYSVEKIWLEASIREQTLFLQVKDNGCGIENIAKAMEPMYTTRPDLERSGMGFAFMEAFMDDIHIESQVNHGTTVFMKKTICGGEEQE